MLILSLVKTSFDVSTIYSSVDAMTKRRTRYRARIFGTILDVSYSSKAITKLCVH